MKIKVKIQGLGPLISTNFEMKPFTIFIGPNNSGKSYAAILIHSLNSTLSNIATYTEILSHKEEILKLSERIKLIKEIKILQELIKENFPIKKVIENIEEAFASSIKEIINFFRENLYVAVENEKIYYSFYINKEEKFGIEELKIKENVEKIVKKMEKEIEIKYKIFATEEELKKTVIFISLLLDIFPLFKSSKFLLSSRAGVSYAHKYIASAIVKLAPRIALAKKEITFPRISSIVSEFITNLIEIKPEFITKEFKEEIEILEKEIFEGKIEVKFEEPLLPEFTYKLKEFEIPIERTSSMISELSPLYIYLKYYIKKGDLLIIEEPEAHLHPEKQRLMAKLLVRLVRKGLNLLITTHSDYLLSQINNYIMLGNLKEEEREKIGYDKNDYLSKNEVSVVLFKKEKDGCYANNLKIEEDGIPEDEFSKVAEALGNETIKIRHKLRIE